MITVKRQPVAAHDADSHGEGSWALSYGDMITLLLMFFVLFFSTDPKVKERERSAFLQDELVNAFKQDAAKTFSTAPGAVAIPSESEPLKDLKIETHKSGQKLITVFPGLSFFDFTETEVTEQGAHALEQFAHKYMPYAGGHILNIRAFTDERPVVTVRRYKDNLELSALRSISAMRILQKAGIPLSEMKVGGYGETRSTTDELRKLASEGSPVNSADRGDPSARKIVLIIEPRVEPQTDPRPKENL